MAEGTARVEPPEPERSQWWPLLLPTGAWEQGVGSARKQL